MVCVLRVTRSHFILNSFIALLLSEIQGSPEVYQNHKKRLLNNHRPAKNLSNILKVSTSF